MKNAVLKSKYTLFISTLIFPLYYFPYYITEIVEANKVTYSISLIYLVTTYFFLLWSDFLILFNNEKVRPLIFKVNMYLKFITLILSIFYSLLFFAVIFLGVVLDGPQVTMKIETLIFIVSVISTFLLWNSISYFKKKYVNK